MIERLERETVRNFVGEALQFVDGAGPSVAVLSAWLKAGRALVPEGRVAHVYFDIHGDYGREVDLRVYYDEPESDEGYMERLRAAEVEKAQRASREEAAARRMFEELKARFEPKPPK